MLGLVLTAGSVLLTAGVAHKYRQKVMSTEAKCIFDSALDTISDPQMLKDLAAKFEASGYKREGAVLRKRADLQSASPETKQAVRESFSLGMASKDVSKLHKLADMFHKSGRVGAANELRTRAVALQTASAVPDKTPIVLPDIPPPVAAPSPVAPVPSPIEPNATTDLAPATKVEDPAKPEGSAT